MMGVINKRLSLSQKALNRLVEVSTANAHSEYPTRGHDPGTLCYEASGVRSGPILHFLT
jgi:hypothetical protein